MISISMKDNKDISCYFTTKHSYWRGKYKRIFSVGTKGITTYNPVTLETTNQWPYEEFVSIIQTDKAPSSNEFCITMKKSAKKTESMRFSTDHRSDLLTEALRYYKLFAEKTFSTKVFKACKHHWSDKKLPVSFEVNPGSLTQIDETTGKILCSYDYKDIEGIALVGDYVNGVSIIHGGFGRQHLFKVENRDEMIKAIQEAATNNIGLCIKLHKDSISFDHFLMQKFGKYSNDESLTSCSEFLVMKLTSRRNDSINRILCLSETCIIERDPLTYQVVTLRPLHDIFSIIRSSNDPQELGIEYVNGKIRKYTSTDRDALLATLIDGVRSSGNRDVHIKMNPTNRGHRLGPFTVPVDEEVESQYLKFLQNPPNGMTQFEVLSRFNSNISYSGLLHAVTAETLFAEKKEKLIYGALSCLLEGGTEVKAIHPEELEAQLQALRRLVASKAGFSAFTTLPHMRERVGLKVVKALKRNDLGVSHAAVDMLCSLIQPMHENYDLKQEQLNKASILSSKKFLENLLDMFTGHINRGSGALVISAMLDFLTYSLCAPYSETTDGAYFDTLLEMVACNGRSIFKLFQHPSLAIVKGTGLVMKAIIEEGDADVAVRMQDLSLVEGALPRHLLIACYTDSIKNHLLTGRQLSRQLISLWVTGHETSLGLLRRIMPSGLLMFLDSKDEVPEEDIDGIIVRDNLKLAQEQEDKRKKNIHWRQIEKHIEDLFSHWKSKIGLEPSQEQQQQEKLVILRKRRQRVKPSANWRLFYYQFSKDHAKPNLIWNFKTREELRRSLGDELRMLNENRDLPESSVVSWNHHEFEVNYKSLDDELKIGDYYLRILLDEDEKDSNSIIIKQSNQFFNDLYHRFLLSSEISMKCKCLHAMSIVYGRCYEEIGPFNDTKSIVMMLEKCTDKLERDRLIIFISKLILNKSNVKDVINSNGIKIHVDLLTLAHLHTSRAVIPTQTNAIVAAPDSEKDSKKEWWYHGNADKEKSGPYSFEEMKRFWKNGDIASSTKCWAQGLDGWIPVRMIPQLKWVLMATGHALLNESELAILILNMFIKITEYYPSRDADNAIVRPLPKIKQILSDASCLSRLVQLLMTFDPVLVEKVSTLLYQVMDENPKMQYLYLSGVFYFILMYTGSNVLPVARFLKAAHMRQAFMRFDENRGSDVMNKSILANLLPESMICYLENYEPEKFAEIYLGEFDTPEAIWNREMRRLMIEKIASHVADFSPRLQSNTCALYNYCPIPLIVYPQLNDELFCSIYYLRHLCDITKFPDWPIKEPVRLLKDVLECWKMELEKKPPTMSIEDALEVLGLDKTTGMDLRKVTVAYRKLALKHHPDKNHGDTEDFKKVNQAYVFLCSTPTLTMGPNPKNIVLILKVQTILFSRFKAVLEPYKYAGYPTLIKTIQFESTDKSLFGKEDPLLSAAVELCYHTINCSALNAEELRRENGIEVLHEAFSRCVNALTVSSKADDLPVQVCSHAVQCLGVSSQFEACRNQIIEMPAIVQQISRIFYFRNVPRLCQHAAECVSQMSIDFVLQTQLYETGVLWHLILFLFDYDFTLEEGGVKKSNESNQQEIQNILAKMAVRSCARLGGYITSKDDKSPANLPVKKSLSSLLTPYLANKLSDDNPTELLKLLTSNSENPLLMWNNETRAELIEYLTDQQQKIKYGMYDKDGLNHQSSGETTDKDYGINFKFTSLSKELIVGDVFVRIYNQQPTFYLDNAKGFTIELLDYLGSQAQYLYSLMTLQNQQNNSTNSSAERISNVESCLEALHNVIMNNPGVEIQCIGHFKLLFSLLRIEGCFTLQQKALEVISSVTGSHECIIDISASEVMAYLLLIISSLPQINQLTLQVLYPLCANKKLLREISNKGGLLYLLDLFCNSPNLAVREQCVELFGRMLSDKLLGTPMRIVMLKFLPSLILDAMRDSPENSIHLFEGIHENPELIWNDESREHVRSKIKEMRENHYNLQKDDPLINWAYNKEMECLYALGRGEVVVGDVYLRLFIENPGWVVRRPKDFMVALFDKWSQLISQTQFDGEVLEMVTTALVSFLSLQSTLLDQVPELGFIPKLFKSMTNKNDVIPRSALLIVQQLANNEVCIRTIGRTDSIGPMREAMEMRKDVIGVGCESLVKMFDANDENLVEQALNTQIIGFLLNLLEKGGLEFLENVSSVKAQIVKVLKAMQLNTKYGDQINELLEKSPVWKDYKSQKHDLFLPDNRSSAGFISGPGRPRYLTCPTGTVESKLPPPVV